MPLSRFVSKFGRYLKKTNCTDQFANLLTIGFLFVKLDVMELKKCIQGEFSYGFTNTHDIWEVSLKFD